MIFLLDKIHIFSGQLNYFFARIKGTKVNFKISSKSIIINFHLRRDGYSSTYEKLIDHTIFDSKIFIANGQKIQGLKRLSIQPQ